MTTVSALDLAAMFERRDGEPCDPADLVAWASRGAGRDVDPGERLPLRTWLDGCMDHLNDPIVVSWLLQAAGARGERVAATWLAWHLETHTPPGTWVDDAVAALRRFAAEGTQASRMACRELLIRHRARRAAGERAAMALSAVLDGDAASRIVGWFSYHFDPSVRSARRAAEVEALLHLAEVTS